MKLAATMVKEASAQAPLGAEGGGLPRCFGDRVPGVAHTRDGTAGSVRRDAGSPQGQSDRIKLKAWGGAANLQLFSSRRVYVG